MIAPPSAARLTRVRRNFLCRIRMGLPLTPLPPLPDWGSGRVMVVLGAARFARRTQRPA
jgi:hypothetical protein